MLYKSDHTNNDFHHVIIVYCYVIIINHFCRLIMSAPPPPITILPPSQPSSTTTTSPEQQKPNELKNPGEFEELGKRAKGTFQMHLGCLVPTSTSVPHCLDCVTNSEKSDYTIHFLVLCVIL